MTRLTSAQFLSAVERKETDYFIGNKLTLKKPEHEENTADVESAIDILSAQFALQTMEKGGEPAELLIKIATGALIAEVVLTLQVSSGSTSLDKLTVFVDGPLLLDRLDLSSIELKEFAKSLFELMEKAKIHVSVFSHTLEEMRGSIKAPLDAMARGEEPFGPLGSRIRWDGSHAAYARSVLDSLESALQELHVTVFDADELRTAAGLHRLPEAIEDSLRNNVGPLFVGLERRIRDAASVSSIMRLRSGPKPHSIADAGSLFVTRNPVVSKASTSHLIFKKVISDTEVPPAMLDRTLAGYLWFVVGGNVGEITRQKLIANCSYVMTPKNDIISKVRQYLTEIDPEKATIFAALLLDRRAQRCLVRATLGFPSAITTENAEAILQEVRESVANEVTEQAAQKEARLRAEHKTEIKALVEAHKAAQERTQAQLESSERLQYANAAELGNIREKLSRAEAEKRSDVDGRMHRAVLSARNSKRGVAGLLLIAYLAIVLVVYELSPAWGIWKLVGALVVALFGFWVVPEITFKFIGTIVWKWRFHKAIASLGLQSNVHEFNVNTESGTATRKAEELGREHNSDGD